MLITKPYKGGVNFIARVLPEQAGLWVKDRNSAARRVKFAEILAQNNAGEILKFAARWKRVQAGRHSG